MTNNGESIMNLLTAGISSMIHLIVAENLMKSMYWSTVPRTPYYLKKRIHFLENRIIEQICYNSEEVIRP